MPAVESVGDFDVDSLELLKDHPISPVVVFDEVHEGPHQHDPPPAGTFEVFVSSRVRDIAQLEPGSLVFDFDTDRVVVNPAEDFDVLVPVHPVPVLDGIHQSFFESQSHSKEVT